MDREHEKKKRSTSKSRDNPTSDKKSTNNAKVQKSTSKERTSEDKSEKTKKHDKNSSKEVNGHSKDKEHKSRDHSKSKPSKNEEKRDSSKTKSSDTISDKRSESKENKERKKDPKKVDKEETKKSSKEDDGQRKSEKKSKHRKDEGETPSSIPTKISEPRKKSAKAKLVENGYSEATNGGQNDDDYNYEEDFEDYEEDFEDDDVEENHNDFEQSNHHAQPQSDDENEKEFEEVTKREIEETVHPPKKSAESDEKLKSSDKTVSDNQKESADSRPRTVQSRIDFTKAKHSEMQILASGKVKRREKELLSLIELDTTTYDLFDLAPVRDYEFFIQNFGKSNMKQVQLQTDDDAVDREIQLDEIDLENKWSQHPPTDLSGCGSDQISATNQESHNFRIDTELLNSTRFRRFIEKSGKLIFELLDEEVTSQLPSFQSKATISFSEGYSIVSLGMLSKKSYTTASLIAPDHSHLFLTAFYVEESPCEDIVNKGVICCWNSNNMEIPQKILLADSEPKCVCFSPDVPSTVFSGLTDGSLAAWDLHESETLHKTIPWKKDEVPLRIPTYDTAYLSRETEDYYINPIVSVVCVGSSNKNLTGPSNNATTYQLAALEETGVITIWTVLMVSNDLLESDLGLSPGGRLKLVKSTTLKPSSGSTHGPASDLSLKRNAHSFCLGYSLLRPSDFYIGTDTGYISHLVRHENKSGPSLYRPELEAISDVMCLHFSPFEPTVLLAGLSDGSICLYKTNLTKPLGVFQLQQSSEAVTSVQWSSTSPYVFYSLHGETKLAFWDLKHNKQAPAQIENVKNVKSMSLSSWVHSDEQIRSKMYMILACTDGTAEVHCLSSSSSSKYSRNDGQKLLAIVERL